MENREDNVLICVRGTQQYSGQEPDVVELTTTGCLYREGEKLILCYEESELTGLEGTVTRFEIEPERVVLSREGSLNSRMEFQVGLVNRSLYDAGTGGLLLTICTIKLENHMEDSGGFLRVRYTVELEDTGRGEVEYYVVASAL